MEALHKETLKLAFTGYFIGVVVGFIIGWICT